MAHDARILMGLSTGGLDPHGDVNRGYLSYKWIGFAEFQYVAGTGTFHVLLYHSTGVIFVPRLRGGQRCIVAAKHMGTVS